MSTEHDDTTRPAQSAVRALLSRIEAQITKWSVQWLTWRLRNDEGFWISYKANIAMAFYDEMSERYPQFRNNPSYDFLPVCNKAAERFMQLWTKR